MITCHGKKPIKEKRKASDRRSLRRWQGEYEIWCTSALAFTKKMQFLQVREEGVMTVQMVIGW